MGKKTAHTPKLTKKYFPFVSVCTPTFNRRPFIPIMLECFRNQDYPKDRMEWIIVDDGTDCIKDLIDTSHIPQIKYFRPPSRMNLGEKRNYMHKQTKGSIIVYMDDDDYYPPERVSHAVERLMENREALCAGSSEMYIYFKHISKMVQCGPYGPNHATAGTFAFRSALLDQTHYNDNAALAEEREFLKDYTIPFVQLDPLKTILVFSHIHNTFDKKRLLENPHPDFLKESSKTVDMFIKRSNEAHIKQFFMTEIDELLSKYDPGHPRMKPEVLAQTKEIEEKRRKMEEDYQAQNNKNANNVTIKMQSPGKEPITLTIEQVVELLQQRERENAALNLKINELNSIILKLENDIISSNKTSTPKKSSHPEIKTNIIKERSKFEPEINISI